MNKKYITDRVNAYKNAGWLVWTFNSNKPLPTGARFFFDHVLISGYGHTVFVEVKLKNTKDGLSDGQILTREHMIYSARFNKKLFYYTIEDEETLVQVEKELDKMTGGELRNFDPGY